MEKFRIAQYGMFQMAAIAYGILAAGVMTKIAKQVWTSHNLPDFFDRLIFYRDYGIFLTSVVVIWAGICSYRLSSASAEKINEETIVLSGIILTAIFVVLGTYCFAMGLAVMQAR